MSGRSLFLWRDTFNLEWIGCSKFRALFARVPIWGPVQMPDVVLAWPCLIVVICLSS